jgi:hypothetical protein
MRKLDLPVSAETSRSITPRTKWVSEYTWTSSDEEFAHMEVDRDADPTGPSSCGWNNWDED